LYESKEWSSYALEGYVHAMGVPAKLLDMQEEPDPGELLACDLVVNRVFASAVFREHQAALRRMPGVIALLKAHGIPMVNPHEAHFYEISKLHSTGALAARGFPVPKVYGIITPAQICESMQIAYPCVVKPDCGGRTNCTFVVHSFQELLQCMREAPDIQFIAEEYIRPEYGFITRIEVIDGSCPLILKRSVTENGLSAYHLGSTYADYKDCRPDIKHTAVRAMDALQIEMGSMDVIENQSGFYIIDINSVSNASEDNTEMFQFDLMKETAAYVAKKYRAMKETPPTGSSICRF
jgi:ribosomal protein S6--L-glutamate ligase